VRAGHRFARTRAGGRSPASIGAESPWRLIALCSTGFRGRVVIAFARIDHAVVILGVNYGGRSYETLLSERSESATDPRDGTKTKRPTSIVVGLSVRQTAAKCRKTWTLEGAEIDEKPCK
jgi:hypothetical protein